MKILKKTILAFGLSLAFAAAATAHDFKVGDLEIIHPGARATVPGAKVGGGFMTIVNNGSEDDRLVGITTPVTNDAQLHEMAVIDDVMKMRQLPDGIPVPAGETVELKSGGLHVMFMAIKQQFVEGEMIKATLHFEKAGDVDVEFTVGPAAGGAMKHDGRDMKNVGGN